MTSGRMGCASRSPYWRPPRSSRWRGGGPDRNMVRLAIRVEAFEAIARTLTLGSVGYENEVNEKGERLI
jgi:hypothetical protein